MTGKSHKMPTKQQTGNLMADRGVKIITVTAFVTKSATT
jgi:hypothetical protein